MKKPLAEWMKYRFGVELGYAVSMIMRGNWKIKVNGIMTKNISYPLKQGDEVELGNKKYEVKWKESNVRPESTDR